SDDTWTSAGGTGTWTLTGNGLRMLLDGYGNDWFVLAIVEGDKMNGSMTQLPNSEGDFFGHRILQVVTPNGGGVYQPGDIVAVTWYETLSAQNVTVDLYENDVFCRNLTTVDVNSYTSYNWTVPADIVTSTKYKIRMTSTTSDIYDESDDYFTIDAVPATPAIEDETFDDGLADNWSAVDGTCSVTDSIYTVNTSGYIVGSSKLDIEVTGNYVFEAKLRAASDVTSYNGGLIVNGDPTVLNGDGDWNNCVVFMINNGAYTFVVIENGVWNTLGSASATEINNVLGEWNILKMIVDNDANDYHIFINGSYMGSYHDTRFNSGTLGLHTAVGATEFDYVKVGPVNKSAMDGIKINRVSTSILGKSNYR
ncbi:MAG TPA: hypothetical protein PKW56_05875, partial [Clostridiales bacterium]|nr:hypothetical protein [Clostridiales bacterium]